MLFSSPVSLFRPRRVNRRLGILPISVSRPSLAVPARTPRVVKIRENYSVILGFLKLA
jgi:hypothetical protein